MELDSYFLSTDRISMAPLLMDSSMDRGGSFLQPNLIFKDKLGIMLQKARAFMLTMQKGINTMESG